MTDDTLAAQVRDLEQDLALMIRHCQERDRRLAEVERERDIARRRVNELEAREIDMCVLQGERDALQREVQELKAKLDGWHKQACHDAHEAARLRRALEKILFVHLS